MVENWNSANKDIFYGKAGDLTGDDREHVEVSALALHLVQASIGYINTRMVQIVLADPPGRETHRRRPARSVGPLLDPSEPVRQVRARHEQATRTLGLGNSCGFDQLAGPAATLRWNWPLLVRSLKPNQKSNGYAF